MTQKKVSGTSSNGPPRNYRGALEVDLKTCAKRAKLRVYTAKFKIQGDRKLRHSICSTLSTKGTSLPYNLIDLFILTPSLSLVR